jgi:S-adenosylmethionine decarboxylase proenzyme
MSSEAQSIEKRPLPPRGLGHHLCIDLHDCQPDHLNSPKEIETLMVAAAKACGAKVVSSHAHHFEPFGVSCMVILAESHLAAHTWPEHGFVAVDIFSCDIALPSQLAAEHLQDKLGAKSISLQQLERGRIQTNNANEQMAMKDLEPFTEDLKLTK